MAALDRFLPLLSNHLNEGHAWKQHAVSPDLVRQKNQPVITDGIPALWRLANHLIDESVRAGVFTEKPAKEVESPIGSGVRGATGSHV